MKKIVLFTVLILSVVTLTGCCQKCRKSREAATRPIQNIVWHLVQFQGEPVNVEGHFEILFAADGTVSGVGACNRFFGTYNVPNPNGVISIGNLAVTKMMCPDIDLETRFINAMQRVHLYQFDDKCLYLFVDNKIVAVFEPSAHRTLE